ncbi:MAG: copper amine oxidase [Verrucomicrobia bacterium]|nr:copper amine oxidase [Verrucomicrobiota bacterium]
MVQNRIPSVSKEQFRVREPLVSRLILVGLLALAAANMESAAAELIAADQEALRGAKQGGVVEMPDLTARRATLPRLPVAIVAAGGPQFLFSDKPEYFLTGNGIALQEGVQPGVVRLYVYHVPTPTNSAKTISAVIENLGAEPMTLRFVRRAFPPPGGHYHAIAKTALAEFFGATPETNVRTIPPGGRTALDPKLDAATATRDQLVHAFYEFEITQPARVTVFQRDPQQRSVEVIDTLPKLPSVIPGKDSGSGAGRGLFLASDFVVTNSPGVVLDTSHGPMQLIVADGRGDPWIKGRDSIENREARNVGNYGTVYRVRLTRASSDGRGLALLMAKTGGGPWCGALAAAVQVNAGRWPGGIVNLPSDRVAFGGTNELVLIQKFPPVPRGQTDVIEIVYSPPGASCLPTPFLFVPIAPGDL